ncbi:MAG: hypothetical protein M3Q87_05775, partial [Actinomycetota bacterium]|nr:hypothetical protein [Actinomycetota bacterium]
AIARLREMTATVSGAVAEADAAAAERTAAAEELWRLRTEHADEPPLAQEQVAAVLAAMSEHVAGIVDAESAAVQRLAAALARSGGSGGPGDG